MNKMNKIIMSETTRSKISFAPNGGFKTSFNDWGDEPQSTVRKMVSMTLRVVSLAPVEPKSDCAM